MGLESLTGRPLDRFEPDATLRDDAVADTIFILRQIHPDRTVVDRRFKVPEDQSCQLRINVHRGRIGKVSVLKELNIPSAPAKGQS